MNFFLSRFNIYDLPEKYINKTWTQPIRTIGTSTWWSKNYNCTLPIDLCLDRMFQFRVLKCDCIYKTILYTAWSYRKLHLIRYLIPFDFRPGVGPKKSIFLGGRKLKRLKFFLVSLVIWMVIIFRSWGCVTLVKQGRWWIHFHSVYYGKCLLCPSVCVSYKMFVLLITDLWYEEAYLCLQRI